MKSSDDRKNHSNQMNPNNDAYWQARGYNERPDDWEDRLSNGKERKVWEIRRDGPNLRKQP